MKKKLISVVATGVLCASMVVPAMADTNGGAVPTLDGTDVYAGITLEDPDAKIKVEVPTLFAFVVNGSVTTDASAVKSAVTDPAGDANILLPNIKVKVDTPSTATGGDGVYHLETEASGNWKFVNYSTKASTAATAVDDREGLEVGISGSIKNEGTEVSRNYWTHIADADTKAADKAAFKQYTLEVNGTKFDTVETDGSFAMAAPIKLDAPDLTVGGVDATTKYAMVGKEIDTTFNVYVGGQRDQYNQVEESAKVGTIVWTIQAESQDGVNTAPNKDYLAPTP